MLEVVYVAKFRHKTTRGRRVREWERVSVLCCRTLIVRWPIWMGLPVAGWRLDVEKVKLQWLTRFSKLPRRLAQTRRNSVLSWSSSPRSTPPCPRTTSATHATAHFMPPRTQTHTAQLQRTGGNLPPCRAPSALKIRTISWQKGFSFCRPLASPSLNTKYSTCTIARAHVAYAAAIYKTQTNNAHFRYYSLYTVLRFWEVSAWVYVVYLWLSEV